MRVVRRAALLVVVLGGLAAIDVAAASVAEGRLAAHAERAVPGSTATAEVSSFPFVGRLLFAGQVRHVALDLDPVRLGALEGQMRVTLWGVRLDRTALVGGDVRLEGIDRGRMRFAFGPAAVGRLAGLPVSIDGGRASVEVDGRQVPAEVDADRRNIYLRAPGLPAIEVEVARPDLVPCEPEASVVGAAIVLACDFDEVPDALVARAVG